MKLQSMNEPSSPKPSNPTRIRGLLIALALLLFTATPLILKTSSPASANRPDGEEDPTSAKKCDIFKGEWVPNPKGPSYTNESCWAIHEHQNCVKYGRPDTDFMRWRWKPHGSGCELPIFDPRQFLRMVTGKSLAFVGDSVARNQMQSLICLLSPVEYPIDKSQTTDDYLKHWHYESFNFTLSMYTTTFLVKSSMETPGGPTGTGVFRLHLDEPDPTWSHHMDAFDYLIISAGHWFFRSLLYYRHNGLIGCRFCQLPNTTQLSIPFGYRAAFRTTFRAILDKFHGTVYLRTFAPSHFEGGDWNNGGNCVRRKPFRSDEAMLQGMALDMYWAQVEEFRAAEREGRDKGVSFRLLDTTQTALLRPDGHPGKYGHLPEEKVVLYNDCVHWCLPGPIDAWNELLLEMMRSGAQKSDGGSMSATVHKGQGDRNEISRPFIFSWGRH